MATEARHLSITGQVQGVGYRASMAHTADSLGISGWCRNRRDGSVEAVICGDAEALARMIAWARRGPPGARVDHVHVELAEPANMFGFELRPTA